jgi:hypothetical protein
MADDYDWDGLAEAVSDFARGQSPIPIRTVGLLTVTGPTSTGITLEPYRDDRLARFHRDLWEVVTPFARGTVAPFYLPDRWVPHVTIKRCGPHREAFGRAMRTLSEDTFLWTMDVDTLNVQHDPANNNLTRYQRIVARLGADGWTTPPTGASNATILTVGDPPSNGGPPCWSVCVRRDDGTQTELRWSAPDVVRITARARAPLVHFAGARCRLEGGAIVEITPATPVPLAT